MYYHIYGFDIIEILIEEKKEDNNNVDLFSSDDEKKDKETNYQKTNRLIEY